MALDHSHPILLVFVQQTDTKKKKKKIEIKQHKTNLKKQITKQENPKKCQNVSLFNKKNYQKTKKKWIRIEIFQTIKAKQTKSKTNIINWS